MSGIMTLKGIKYGVMTGAMYIIGYKALVGHLPNILISPLFYGFFGGISIISLIISAIMGKGDKGWVGAFCLAVYFHCWVCVAFHSSIYYFILLVGWCNKIC